MASVSCLFAVEFEFQAPHHCGWHTHPCTEIVLYRGCSGVLVQDEVESRYADGCLAIYQPRQRHADHCTSSGFQFCLGINGCGAETLPPGVYPLPAACAEVVALLRRELRTTDSLRGMRLDLLAGLLVAGLRQASLGQAAPRRRAPPAGGRAAAELPRLVRSAKEIFDSRFADGVRVGEVADTLFVSPDYLRQLFRSALGESPISYLLRRRMEAAKELLVMSEATVAAVAKTTGFDNPYYFCRMFKKCVGLTPSQHRQRHRAAIARGDGGGGGERR